MTQPTLSSFLSRFPQPAEGQTKEPSAKRAKIVQKVEVTAAKKTGGVKSEVTLKEENAGAQTETTTSDDATPISNTNTPATTNTTEQKTEQSTPLVTSQIPSAKIKQTDTETVLESKDTKIVVKGAELPYAELASAFEKLEATTKRLEKITILQRFFGKVITESPQAVVQCVYLCLNATCPTWEGSELGIGPTLLLKAVSAATGRPVAKLKVDMKEKGDLGTVAQDSKSNQPTFGLKKNLTVPGVFAVLRDISKMTGSQVQNKKIEKIQQLLMSCKGNETKYIIRSLEGKLRIGVQDKTVLTAVAQASVYASHGSEKGVTPELLNDAVEMLKQVYCACPSFDLVLPVLTTHGWKKLPEYCYLTPGVPVQPMLAHPTKRITDVLKRFEDIRFTCEWKYDGERAQVHKLPSGEIQVFSRNQENMTGKYPDLAKKLADVSSAETFILDAEVVAWDPENQGILPFQVLSTRKRKDADVDTLKVDVCLFGFDLIYLNGESFLQKSLPYRREKLFSNFKVQPGKFQYTTFLDTDSIEAIQVFLDEAIVGRCEGLMVKTLAEDSTYEPSSRSRNWLKLKKDYLEGIGDSLDLVVVGGYTGKGKRTGGYGGFLLACYDEDTENFQVICKIGTGFSQEQLLTHAAFFKDHEIDSPRSDYSFGDGVKPDVWFNPVQVWEVKAADLSISPIYHAGLGLVDPSKGISLRFPRFIRIRDDKSPEQATSGTQVAEMYKTQQLHFAEQGDEADEKD